MDKKRIAQVVHAGTDHNDDRYVTAKKREE